MDVSRWFPLCCPVASVVRPYNFPRRLLTTLRIAFSSRRYHRHCPCFAASTKPALVKMPI